MFSGGHFCFGARGGSVEGFTWEDLSMDEFIIGKRISMKGAHDFLALLKKNNDKLNNSFFNWK